MDALEVLKADHDKVRSLFIEFRAASEADATDKMAEVTAGMGHASGDGRSQPGDHYLGRRPGESVGGGDSHRDPAARQPNGADTYMINTDPPVS